MAKFREPQRMNALPDEAEQERQDLVAIRLGKTMKLLNEECALPLIVIGEVSYQPHPRHLPTGTPVTVYVCDQMTLTEVRDYLLKVARMLDVAIAVAGDSGGRDEKTQYVPHPNLN